MQKTVNNENVFGALLTNLSKEFDCLPNVLIIAKLNSYGLNLTAQNSFIIILQPYSSWEDILFRLPQGTILGQILFNIFLSDLCLIFDDADIANYADNSTIYKEHENIDDLITSVEDVAAKLFKQYFDNQMKGNTDKCHSLLSKDESSEVHIGDSIIESSNREKLLGIKIDSKLLFDDHIQDICNKANSKIMTISSSNSLHESSKRKF